MTASETIFQKQITDVQAAFEAAGTQLGFGPNVDTNGFEIPNLMPTVVGLGSIGAQCHQMLGRVIVIVYNDPSCGAVTDAQLATKIYTIVNGAVPGGKVWDHLRFSKGEEEFIDFYVAGTEDDASDKRANVWFTRRVGLTNQRSGGIDNDLISRTHEFELRYLRGILEADGA